MSWIYPEGETAQRRLWRGNKVPKGWQELPGGMHLGAGIWLLPCEPTPQRTNVSSGPMPPRRSKQ